VKRLGQIYAVFLRLAMLVFIGAAGWLTYSQYQRFTLARSVYPPGSSIAGIGVGGLNQQQALDRLILAYGLPVELRYGSALIQPSPAALGFELDLTAMLTRAEVRRIQQPLPEAFWDYLWQRKPGAFDIPLEARINNERIRAYLQNEIAPRYDQAAQAALPVPGTTRFLPGKPGSALQVEPAVPLIAAALRSLTDRRVELSSSPVSPPPAVLQNLQVLLKQQLILSNFTGIAEVYVQDLKNQQELHFAAQNGKEIPADIGFTAASTIKIPIMIATFRRSAEPTSQAVQDKLASMIEISENDPADWLMQQMDKNNGPLEVTRDIQALGLKNTFLAGYFYPGAPLLKRFVTPANQRKDYFTDPDPYNQTSPAEMGRLLGDIYQCAQNGGGAFATVFPGQISQNECKQMEHYLELNTLPVLLAAGVPEGTRMGHKHGWIQELDGVVHTYCDAALVFSPGGDFVMTVYLWKKEQILFDPANSIMADLAQTTYNYFNIPAQ
jgi:beta-lactamase class A